MWRTREEEEAILDGYDVRARASELLRDPKKMEALRQKLRVPKSCADSGRLARLERLASLKHSVTPLELADKLMVNGLNLSEIFQRHGRTLCRVEDLEVSLKWTRWAVLGACGYIAGDIAARLLL